LCRLEITLLTYLFTYLHIVGPSVDASLVDVLASLAAETSADLSRDEDVDSVLSQSVVPLSADDRREIAEETLEMSQRVWDEDGPLPAADADAAATDWSVLQSLAFLSSIFSLP